MTKKGKDTEIISISLPQGVAKEMDRLVVDLEYPSRSELVREALRDFIRSKKEMDGVEGDVDGVMILLYDHKASLVVSDIRHANMHLFKSFMHTDFEDHSCNIHDAACKCCEVLLFSGDAREVRRVHDRFRANKHVEESLLFLA